MSLVGTAVTVSLWIGVGLVAYAVAAYVVLFYLPRAVELPNGAVADIAFGATLPFVLAVTWLAGYRYRWNARR